MRPRRICRGRNPAPLRDRALVVVRFNEAAANMPRKEELATQDAKKHPRFNEAAANMPRKATRSGCYELPKSMLQ